MSGVRRATHAGSWYTDDGRKLTKQLAEWLDDAEGSPLAIPRAIIVPHAGYRYSGPSAAKGYKLLDPSKIKRIFILGPSHHAYMTKCGLSKLTEYETPIGSLKLDRDIIKDLYATGSFEYISADVEEAEHSIEMHLPYIAQVMGRHDFTIIPIMVGSIKQDAEEQYGKLLAPYLKDEETLFVVSSDFCHWGKRFDYTPYDESQGAIHQSIEALDRRGMQIIQGGDPIAFSNYLKETKNTICGRHPISVMLWALRHYQESPAVIRLVHYEQSSQCTNMRDSSVSYGVLSAAFQQ